MLPHIGADAWQTQNEEIHTTAGEHRFAPLQEVRDSGLAAREVFNAGFHTVVPEQMAMGVEHALGHEVVEFFFEEDAILFTVVYRHAET